MEGDEKRQELQVLDAEIDQILSAEPPPPKKPRGFGLGKTRRDNLPPPNARQTMSFGRAQSTDKRVNKRFWADEGRTPDFTTSVLPTSREQNPAPYSISNQFSNKPRPTIPSTRIVPGKALLGTEAKKTPIYSAPHKDLLRVSKPADRGILENCSGGKLWPSRGQVLTPPGKKVLKSTVPTDSSSWRSHDAADDEIDSRHALNRRPKVDDQMFMLKRPLQMKHQTFSRRESAPTPRPFRDSPPRRQSGGTAEKPIHLSDSEDDEKKPNNELELMCRTVLYRTKRYRDKPVKFLEKSLRLTIHEIMYSLIVEVLISKLSPIFVVIKLEGDTSFLALQPSSESACLNLIDRLRQSHGFLPLRELNDADDEEYLKFKEIVIDRQARRVKSSPVVLTYPLPPDATDVITITQEDLTRLQPQEYFNDNLVDYYFKWLLAVKMPQCAPYTICLSSHFFTQLRDNLENVATWFSPQSLLQKDLIFVPINMNVHWSLAVIIRPKNFTLGDTSEQPTVIATIDSMGQFHRRSKILSNLKHFLAAHSDLDEEACQAIKGQVLYGPQQSNAHDCGVYMLLAAQSIMAKFGKARKRGVTIDVDDLLDKHAFSQADVDRTRQVMLDNLNADAEKYAQLMQDRQ